VSAFPRIVLGVLCAIIAAGFFWAASYFRSHPTTSSTGLFAVGVFCALITAACLLPGVRGIALRIIGGTVFAVFVWYVIASIGSVDLLRALLGLVVLGLPGGYVAVMGRYPGWGKAAEAFGHGDGDD
jgi:hypothetical protein